MAYGAGAKVTGKGGVGTGVGTGTNAGSGGNGTGFGGRGSGHRRANWAATAAPRPANAPWPAPCTGSIRHQLSDGQLEPQPQAAVHRPDVHRSGRARRPTPAPPPWASCPSSPPDRRTRPTAPTASASKTRLLWLLRHQERDGNLAKGCVQPMYSHGMATIALCEAYGLSGDHNIGAAAQGAVELHPRRPKQDRLRLALQPRRPRRHLRRRLASHGSEERADGGLERGRLRGSGSIFDLACKWFDLVKCGPNGCNFQYQPDTGPTPAMSAVGLLCRQYMGTKRDRPDDDRRRRVLDEEHARRENPQRLLLVLRDASDAQLRRLRVGHLEPRDAEAVDQHADRDRTPAPTGVGTRTIRPRTPGARRPAATT